MKTSKFSRRAVLQGTTAGLAAGILPVHRAFAKEVIVGLVYVGPRDDFGWNQAHAVAAKALKAVAGVKGVEEENVPETVAVTKSMESMINLDGANLIFATSFGYFDPFVVDVAKKFPNVQLRHAAPLWSKDKHPMNAGSYFGYLNQAHYVNGVAAGAGMGFALAGDIVIAADTVVIHEGRLYGKPTSAEDAAAMLRHYSAQTGLESTQRMNLGLARYVVEHQEPGLISATGEPDRARGVFEFQQNGGFKRQRVSAFRVERQRFFRRFESRRFIAADEMELPDPDIGVDIRRIEPNDLLQDPEHAAEIPARFGDVGEAGERREVSFVDLERVLKLHVRAAEIFLRQKLHAAFGVFRDTLFRRRAGRRRQEKRGGKTRQPQSRRFVC